MQYVLTISIDEDPSDPQRHIRKLRSWLKASLRCWKVRCISVVPSIDNAPAGHVVRQERRETSDAL